MDALDMPSRRDADACLLVIPARRRSTRLPEKLLLRETGKTVLQHTFEAACGLLRRPAVCGVQMPSSLRPTILKLRPRLGDLVPPW